MTLDEAKEFYFQYCGLSFHMDREEPVRYRSFQNLNISRDTLREWDEELLDGYFRKLRQEDDRMWVYHGYILKIISRKNCDTEKYLTRLLDEMEKMKTADLFQITLITENMAGRTEPMKDGGVYLFCQSSGMAGRMNDIMERLINLYSGRPDADKRFETAVSNYRKAYRTWSSSSR